MKLKPGYEAEYKRRHDRAIWPELSAQLRAQGIYDYSIFLDPPLPATFSPCKSSPTTTRPQIFPIRTS